MNVFWAATLAAILSGPAAAATYTYEFQAKLTKEYVDEVYLWGEDYENVGEISTDELGVPGYFGANGFRKWFRGKVSFEADASGNITELYECRLGAKACFKEEWDGLGEMSRIGRRKRDVSISLADGIGSESIHFSPSWISFQSDYGYVLPKLPEDQGYFLGSFYDAEFRVSGFRLPSPVVSATLSKAAAEPAPVPLPAGALLLVSALGILAAAQRRSA